MPRPPLPVGTYGKIERTQAGPHSYRARTGFRNYDGITRDIEAYGPTGTAAENALRRSCGTAPCQARQRSTLAQLTELWLEEIIGEERVSKQSIDRYRDVIRRWSCQHSVDCESGKQPSPASTDP